MSDPLQSDAIDEDRRRIFERAWIQGKPTRLEDFLPAESDPCYLATLEELIHIEIEMAWKRCFANASKRPEDDLETAEHPPTVESYVTRFSTLNSPAVVLRLLKQECLVRKQYNIPLSLETCQARFPQLQLDRIEMAPFLEELRHVESNAPGVTIAPDGIGETSIPLPFIFGDYELLEELGRGGMGVVYRARQLSTPRILAIKVLRSHSLDGISSDASKRFQQEIRATTKLKHDNIVNVFEVGQINGQHFFSMRYIHGKSLGRIIARRPIENRLAAIYLEQVARAIAYSHRSGILHRDLKPGNILVDEYPDRPLVVDFGLAKITDRTQVLTSAGQTVGTPSYMSPEQARDASSATEQSDIYALGATLYAALCGRPPFCAASTAETLRQLAEEDPIPPRMLNLEVDRDLQTICMKCLQKNPYSRYESAGDFADDLSCYLEGKKIRARPTGIFSDIWRQWRRDPRPMTTTAILLILVMIAVALGAISYSQSLAVRWNSTKRLQEAQRTVDTLVEDLYDAQQRQAIAQPTNHQAILNKLLTYYQNIISKAAFDSRRQEDLAAAYYQKGRIEAAIGNLPAALISLQAATEHQKNRLQQKAHDPELSYELSKSLEAVGRICSLSGKMKKSIAAHREAAALRQMLASRSPSNPLYQRQYAVSMVNIGVVERDRQHFNSAREHFLKSETEYLNLLEKQPIDSEVHSELGTCYYNLAQLDRIDGSLIDYRQHLKNAANQFQEYIKGHEDNLDMHAVWLMVNTCRDLGNSYLHKQQPKDAASWYAKGEHVHQLLPVDRSTAINYDALIADLYARWGEALRAEGQFAKALSKCQQSLDRWQKLMVLHMDIPEYARDYAMTLGRVARVQMDMNDQITARKNLTKAKLVLSQLVQTHPGQREFQPPLEDILGLLHQLERYPLDR